MEDKIVCFVSDVHSQHQKLENALYWIYSNIDKPYIVVMGDVLDSRLDNIEKNYPPFSDPKKTFEIVRDLVDNESAILLQSNHQDKLKRWLGHHLDSNKPNPVTTNQGLGYTISQFVEKLSIEDREQLRQWLSVLPYHVVIDTYDLLHDTVLSFLCSHAYFNVKANLQTPSKTHQQEALYGVLERDNNRVDWWSADTPLGYYDKPAVRIAGHYHILAKGKNQRVIDSGCGSTGGTLCVHVPAYNLYNEF